MNNNMNMAAMNAMAGQVGGGIPMMNNAMPGGQRQQQQQAQQQQQQQQHHAISPETSKLQLNTYIYEYFLYNQMFDCARALVNSSEPLNVHKNSSRRRDANGMDLGGDEEDSKDHFDTNRPDDLPAPNVPQDFPEGCFLFEWWSLFWDMFNAQRGAHGRTDVKTYQQLTQQLQRAQQEKQQSMIRNMSMGQGGGLMRQGPNGMQNEIARKAMQNNSGRPLTQEQMRTMHQQRQQQMQMQRGSSEQHGAGSPGSGEGAPSPSKRPRLDGAQFAGPMGMPNGRGQGIPGQMGGGPGGNGPQNPMMLTNGMNAGNLAAQQFQNYPGQGGPNAANKANLQQYTNQLAQHQQAQKAMVNPNGPQGQGSPMMPQGPEGQQFFGGDMMANGRPGGPAAGQGQTGSHALQDYQMQLMLLEQQNKKRLLMARQEQDSMSITRDGPPGPNGQPFPSTSPNGARSVNSPNPSEMMKRGTPQMAPGVIPSPEGQSRGSPASMNFIPQNMNPEMAPHFYNKTPMNGMEGGMMGPNGMRQPPSSHPAVFNNGQMNQQQLLNMQRQQQQQANAGQVSGWNGPNAAPMMQQQGSQQGSQQGPMGTPQQRPMAPPAVPAAAQAPNGRTQPSSPQQAPAPPTPSQTKKANPKAKKETKPKVRKSSIAEPEGQPLTAKQRKAGQAAAGPTGATPVGDGAPEQPPTPTPQTPITPAHPMSFNPKNGPNGQQGGNNSQPAAPTVSQPPPISQPQVLDAQNGFPMDEFSMPIDGMDFAHPMAGSDVLQDFDFDSFLHQDSGEADVTQFNFGGDFVLEGEVGAE